MPKKNKRLNFGTKLHDFQKNYKKPKFNDFEIVNLDKYPEKKNANAVILYDTNENNLVIKRKKIRNYFLAIVFSSLLIILVIIMLIIIFARI